MQEPRHKDSFLAALVHRSARVAELLLRRAQLDSSLDRSANLRAALCRSRAPDRAYWLGPFACKPEPPTVATPTMAADTWPSPSRGGASSPCDGRGYSHAPSSVAFASFCASSPQRAGALFLPRALSHELTVFAPGWFAAPRGVPNPTFTAASTDALSVATPLDVVTPAVASLAIARAVQLEAAPS